MEGTRSTNQLDKNFEGSAGRINDRADFLGTREMFFAGNIGRHDFELLQAANAAKKSFRQSEAHQERRFRGDPEQAVALANRLSFAHIAARDQSAEWRSNFCFFQ